MTLLFLQENDSKRARAVKKANDERELKKQKDKEIDRFVVCFWVMMKR